MFHFGFSYVGLIYLLMLFVPNIIWAKNKPEGYDEAAKKENPVLVMLENLRKVNSGEIFIFKFASDIVNIVLFTAICFRSRI